MQYSINPMWFYWLSVFNGIKAVCILLSIFIGIGALINLCLYISDDCCKCTGRCLKVLLIAFSVFLICGIFIPSRNTLIAMMIAKKAAVYSGQDLLDAIKNAVDYVIQVIQNAK